MFCREKHKKNFKLRNLIVSLCTVLAISLSCTSSTQTTDDRVRSSLSVTYFGKEIHRRGSEYVSERELGDILSRRTGQSFIIFSAEWCKACKTTKKSIKNANINLPIYWVDLDEPWAGKLAMTMGIKGIPLMVHLNAQGKTVSAQMGPGQILIYLLMQPRK